MKKILVSKINSDLDINNLNNEFFPLNFDKIKSLYEDGHNIGSHTKSHLRLSELNIEQKYDQLVKSKEYIEKLYQKLISLHSRLEILTL